MFPRLQVDLSAITGPSTRDYNCLAWALEFTDDWWWPTGQKGGWDEGVVREETVGAFVQLFGKRGYVDCDNAELEAGYTKIAIYVKERRPTHVARQLTDGFWTSKLGEGPCVTHRTLQSLEGIYNTGYGLVAVVMKRKA